MVRFFYPILAIFALSSHAQATDFFHADELFSKRDQGRAQALEAKEAYRAIIDQGAKNADLVRAVEGLARTYIYENSAYLKIDNASEKVQRKKNANECWNKVSDIISPNKLGNSMALYWYIRSACLAQEAEVSSTLERLANLSKLLDALDKGLTSPGGDIFEGGGIKRVKAAVKGNPEAKGIPGGLYNPTEALKLIDEAIAAEAYPGNVEGFLFCENFKRKVMILKELNRTEESKGLAASTIEDFNGYLAEGLIPEFIRAETTFCINQLESLK